MASGVPASNSEGFDLCGTVIAQRPNLVADGRDHEDDCDEREESNCLPESLGGFFFFFFF